MSPLKSKDKIMIIGGIVVLVIAVIGIALYVQPTPETPITPSTNQTGTYEVTWNKQSGSLSEISEFAEKKTPYEGTIAIPVGNIESITFNLSWIDDHTFLKRFGLDTLTLGITTPDGKTTSGMAKSAKITKAGNVAITIPVNSMAPSGNSIAATSPSDAQNQLQDILNNKWMRKDITVKVSVTIGEIRILKRFQDKGNDFTLKVDYKYYKGTVTPINDNSNNQNQPTSLDTEDWRATPFSSISYVGRT